MFSDYGIIIPHKNHFVKRFSEIFFQILKKFSDFFKKVLTSSDFGVIIASQEQNLEHIRAFSFHFTKTHTI